MSDKNASFSSSPTSGADRLRQDIEAVRKLFTSPRFEGRFDMRSWFVGPDNASSATHWCGTTACLGGWIELAGLNGFTGFNQEAIYEMTDGDSKALFFDWNRKTVNDLEAKLAQASAIADAIEARSKKANPK